MQEKPSQETTSRGTSQEDRLTKRHRVVQISLGSPRRPHRNLQRRSKTPQRPDARERPNATEAERNAPAVVAADKKQGRTPAGQSHFAAGAALARASCAVTATGNAQRHRRRHGALNHGMSQNNKVTKRRLMA